MNEPTLSITHFISSSQLLLFSLLLLLLLHVPQLCQGSNDNLKKFYIYDWPESVLDLWPERYDHHRLSFASAEFRDNNGFGRLLDQQTGAYFTHQYSLFTIVYQRLLTSPYRTLDPEEASAFFIPYDLGMDSSTRRSDGALVRTNCPQVCIECHRFVIAL
jgi:hypothetical protein